MNVVQPLLPQIEPAAWDEAVAEVNRWRGQAIQHFAQAECAVSETLLKMHSVAPADAKVRLRPLVGQRFEDLAQAVAADSLFGLPGAKAAAALGDFRKNEGLRPFLCHGSAKITRDRHGHWLAVFKLLAFRAGSGQRDTLVMGEREASLLLSQLKSSSNALASALQSLRDRATSTFPASPPPQSMRDS